MMVHTKTDLYVSVRLLDYGLWSYLSGECVGYNGGLFVNFNELQKKLPILLAQAEKQRDRLNDCHGREDTEFDVRMPRRLKKLKDQTGRGLEPYWWGESGFIKGVYRGVILEINDSLRVIGFDDCAILSDAASEGDGSPLEEVFDQIDEAGGCEEERIEESEEPEVSRAQAAVH